MRGKDEAILLGCIGMLDLPTELPSSEDMGVILLAL